MVFTTRSRSCHQRSPPRGRDTTTHQRTECSSHPPAKSDSDGGFHAAPADPKSPIVLNPASNSDMIYRQPALDHHLPKVSIAEANTAGTNKHSTITASSKCLTRNSAGRFRFTDSPYDLYDRICSSSKLFVLGGISVFQLAARNRFAGSPSIIRIIAASAPVWSRPSKFSRNHSLALT